MKKHLTNIYGYAIIIIENEREVKGYGKNKKRTYFNK